MCMLEFKAQPQKLNVTVSGLQTVLRILKTTTVLYLFSTAWIKVINYPIVIYDIMSEYLGSPF